MAPLLISHSPFCGTYSPPLTAHTFSIPYNEQKQRWM